MRVQLASSSNEAGTMATDSRFIDYVIEQLDVARA